MRLKDLEKHQDFKCLQSDYTEADLEGAYTSDLLSDVMANAQEKGLLITIQAHRNTVAVANLAEIKGIIICNEREIPPNMIEAAAGEKIAIFQTKLNQFDCSVLIGKLLNI